MSQQPSIKQIAFAADVSTATVDRVLNGRPGVREKTRKKVEAAIESLTHSQNVRSAPDLKGLRIAFVLNTTDLLTTAYEALIPRLAARLGLVQPPLVLRFAADQVVEAAHEMRHFANGLDGVVLVARWNQEMVGQINATAEAGTDVVCVTTDFPGSRRLCYVGMDQVVAGRLAARLVALRQSGPDQLVGLHIGRNWRCEGEREMGFRSTLRELNFQGEIVEMPTSGGTAEEAYDLLTGLRKRGRHVDFVYSPSSGVLGLSKAIEDQDPDKRTFIIGHELFAPLKDLLDAGMLGAQVAANNFDVLTECLKMLALRRAGQLVPSSVFLPTHLVTKENAGLLDWY